MSTLAWVALGLGGSVASGLFFGRLCRWADRDYLPAGVERVKHPLPKIPEWANPYAAPECPDAVAVYEGQLVEVWL